MDINQLREEIRDFHKARIDLHKWKLIAVAALGSIGLGFTGTTQNNTLIQPFLVLSLIPLILLYIDLLQRDLVLKVRVIGKFINEYNNTTNTDFLYQKFESFVYSAHKENVYKFEGYASNLSSIIINILLLTYSFLNIKSQSNPAFLLIPLSSFLGIILTFAIEFLYKQKRNKILELKI